jgi:hypothetical protein
MMICIVAFSKVVINFNYYDVHLQIYRGCGIDEGSEVKITIQWRLLQRQIVSLHTHESISQCYVYMYMRVRKVSLSTAKCFKLSQQPQSA